MNPEQMLYGPTALARAINRPGVKGETRQPYPSGGVIQQFRGVLDRLERLAVRAEHLEEQLRDAEQAFVAPRMDEQRVAAAQASAVEAERRADAAEKRAADAWGQLELLISVIREELCYARPEIKTTFLGLRGALKPLPSIPMRGLCRI